MAKLTDPATGHPPGRVAHTEVVVVRHGETVWNAERRMQGQQDSPLSARGRAQAQALGTRMRHEVFDHLYSSDLTRAHETAEAIAAVTGHEVKLDPRLRERAFGIFEGLTRDEMASRHPAEYEFFRSRDPDYTLPGGESARSFYTRSMACFLDLTERHRGCRIVIVAHGMLLDSLYRAAHDLDLISPRRVDIINASLNTFRRHSGRWHMLEWGDQAHLENVVVVDHQTGPHGTSG